MITPTCCYANNVCCVLPCQQEQVVSVCLCDTSGAEDLHINDLLVQERYAIYQQDDYYALSPRLTHPLSVVSHPTTTTLCYTLYLFSKSKYMLFK